MKYFLGFVSIAILSAMILVAWYNPSYNIALSLPFFKLTIYTTYFVYAALLSVCGFIAGVLFGGAFAIGQKEKISPIRRQLEKLTVQKDSNQSRVEVLEAKIKTLETALQKSLDDK